MAKMIGKQLSLFTVGGGAHLARIRQCEIEMSVEEQENRALQDSSRYVIPTVNDWNIRFTIAADNLLTFSTNTKTNATDLMARIGTSVAFTVNTADAAGNGTSYTGTGLLQSGTHTVPDGLQELSFEIHPQGDLTVTQL